MTQFSDYIVYVDESGDHGLRNIDPEFPVFCLAFCIIEKTEYYNKVVPALQELKFRYWGHDTVVLHEHDIRIQRGDFSFLRGDSATREVFMSEIESLVQNTSMKIIASVIQKDKLNKKYSLPDNPYELAMRFCLERLLRFLLSNKQAGKTVHVVFECRGREEDRDLELEFRRICHGNRQWGYKTLNFRTVDMQIRLAKKAINSAGLQLADLVARPIALNTIRPNQPNRAYQTIRPKLYEEVKVFP